MAKTLVIEGRVQSPGRGRKRQAYHTLSCEQCGRAFTSPTLARFCKSACYRAWKYGSGKRSV